MDMNVNVYLEDWSNGMLDSEEYVFFMMDALKDKNIQHFMLPDTLGVLNPDQTYELIEKMTDRYPDTRFDFHAHNDYDLAVANAYAAVKAGAQGVHVTVNGLGERAGNAPLSSIVAVIHDQLGYETSVKEEKINHISRLVETFSGIRIPVNKPVIGENVFTQTSGVHADGDNKDNLYFNRLIPERFGRKRVYALGKLSGKANIEKNLEEMGLNLSPESLKKVTNRVIELGDKKETVTQEDLPFIISDVLRNGHNDKKITITNYTLSISASMKPMASVQLEIEGVPYEEASFGDGQYDAFMNALWKIYNHLGKPHPVLKNYRVSIPPGGKTDALVETRITWDYNGKQIVTKGLDADQTVSAIKATERMLNIIENVY
jgi:D-citramalate synthase